MIPARILARRFLQHHDLEKRPAETAQAKLGRFQAERVMNLFTTYFSTALSVVGQTVSGSSRPRSNGPSAALVEASKGQVTAVFQTLGTTPDGLTESEVQTRLETYGRHTVAQERATAWPGVPLVARGRGVARDGADDRHRHPSVRPP